LTDPAKRVLSGPPSVINSASSAHSPPASSPSSVTAQTNRTQRGMVYALLSGIGGLIVLGALGWRWRRRQTQSESESPPISES
jgi:hypothetical protein